MKNLTAILIFILINAICNGQIINIPDDYPTIQAGINAAINGDTVLVEQGTYFENINFSGKAIIVASHYILESDSAHITNTIINGSQPANPDIGSVVSFDSSTDTTSCLLGFTITGGTGTIPFFPFPVKTGGGVAFTSAGGKLESNIIEDNACILDTQDGFIFGGGIGSGPPLEDHLIVIKKNIIRNNVAWTKGPSSNWNLGWAEGGGIYLCYNAIVEGNIIESNTSRSDNRIGAGGGIRMIADGQSMTHQILVEVRDNLIKNNESISETFGAFAGGISCSAANTIIEHNTISGNSVESQNYCRGTGLYFDLTNSYYAVVNNNFILDNVSIDGNSNGGAIGLYQSIDIEVCNNVIANNTADNGGAFSIELSSPRLIANNTIINNTAYEEGGSFYVYGYSAAEVINSILRDNNANGTTDEIYFENESTVWIEHSNVSGGWSMGNEIIDEDPLFIGSGDHPYSLGDDSPCIDFGTIDTSGLNLPQWDIMGNYRILDGDDNGDARIDMGAYEYDLATDIPNIRRSNIKVRCYPNPISSNVSIEFNLTQPTFVSLTIHNILGQEITKLISRQISEGTHKLNWNVKDLNEGVYFFVFKTNSTGAGQTIKMIKL